MRSRGLMAAMGIVVVLSGCPDPILNPGTTGSSTSTVKGAFVGGAVQPSGNAVQVRGQFVWHARVSEGGGDVRVKGWLR